MPFSSAMTSIRMWLRAVFRRGRVETDMSKEMQFHLERETELNVRRGLPLDEARRTARLAFGGIERMKDASRDARGTERVDSILRDVHYALRSLRGRPAFTLTVVATLAIGIGANAAIFTLVDALLLRPLPVPHPEQLVIVSDPAAVNTNSMGTPLTDFVSLPVYREVRARNAVFTDMYASGATGSLDVQIGGAGSAVEQPNARFVTGNFFSVLGVNAYAGRSFSAQEDQTAGGDPFAVLTYDYWQRRFAGSPAAIGGIMRVNDVAVTIVGVMPPGFAGDVVGQPVDFWLPMMMEGAIQPRMNMLDDRRWSWVVMMGRLKPGVTLEQARHEMTALEANVIREHLGGSDRTQFDQNLKGTPIQVVPGARGFSERRAEYGKALWVLMAAVGLVILVVCANVSSLMLARTVARGREMTLRLTLGASQARLVQQLLVEGTLLAVVSSVLGLFAARLGSRVLLATVNAFNGASHVAIDTTPNLRVVAFTAAMALGCVLLFGLLPAFRAARASHGDLASSLRSGGRNLMGAARVGRLPFGRVLAAAQLALSMLLLIGGGLLLHSMRQLLHSDIGVDRDHTVAVRVRTANSRYVGARLTQFRQDLASRVARVPGVDAVAFADHGLFSGGNSNRLVDVPGFVAQADSERGVSLDRVGPNFFHAVGARLIRGRDVEAGDLESGRPVAVINETMAKRYFGDRDPVGSAVTVDSVPRTIVGVVKDFHSRDVRSAPRREMYVLFTDATVGDAGQAKLAVHVRGDPSRFVGSIRRAVQDVDATLPTFVNPVSDLIRGTVSQDVLLVQVTVFFCVVTLLLAALGLYGVIAYSTSQRTSEFGLRLALGAEPGRVTSMVLREGVRVAAIGVVVGVPAGLAATRLIRAQLFGVGSIDVLSISVAILVLVATAVVASYVPARRAAKVGPLEALRLE